jgi:hypothetical protein
LTFLANRLASAAAKLGTDVTGQRWIGVVRFGGLVARRGLQEQAMGVRLAGFAAGGLKRRRGFQSAFFTMAVLLIAEGAFFSVFGGFVYCIYVLRLVWGVSKTRGRFALLRFAAQTFEPDALFQTW